MKIQNKLLVILAILLYLVQIPLYIAFVLLFTKIDNDELIQGLFLGNIIGNFILLPLCLTIFILSLIGIKKGIYNPSKISLIVKISLIPWFIFNFVVDFCLVLGFLNPILMFAIPLLILFMVSFTYIFMLTTSIPELAFVVYNVLNKKIKPDTYLILSSICLFIFCLDLVGIFLQYRMYGEL